MIVLILAYVFFFSSRRRHTRSLCDWSSDVCSSDLENASHPARRAQVDHTYMRAARRMRRILPSLADIGEETRAASVFFRSEERRVGKECRSGRAAYH